MQGGRSEVDVLDVHRVRVLNEGLQHIAVPRTSGVMQCTLATLVYVGCVRALFFEQAACQHDVVFSRGFAEGFIVFFVLI